MSADKVENKITSTTAPTYPGTLNQLLTHSSHICLHHLYLKVVLSELAQKASESLPHYPPLNLSCSVILQQFGPGLFLPELQACSCTLVYASCSCALELDVIIV